MKQWLKRLLHIDIPPKEDKYGDTICYCGKKIFGMSNIFWIFYTVTCRNCKHWWWE